jgi:imidazolonepropionase-like amidohydrolase
MLQSQSPHAHLFENCLIFDGHSDVLFPGNVLVHDGRIAEISDHPITIRQATRIDVGGRTLMPGLIDAHAHPCLTHIDGHALGAEPKSLNTARAAKALRAMLDRGFTSIRDAAGSDWGLKAAVEQGLFWGPRLFIAGRALSQTGGHGDLRARVESEGCACGSMLHLSSCIADGVDEVRKAVREQLRLGADQIKVMISGGVTSPNDPLGHSQYSEAELTVIVEEAQRWGKYVMAHAYTAEAIQHGLNCRVRSFEHANLIDAATAASVASAGAFVVPTLSTYAALSAERASLALSDAMVAKLDHVLEAGQRAIDICKTANVQLGFGTDLLGEMQKQQSNEFRLRGALQPAVDVLRSATSVNAALLQQKGVLGEISVGACADIIVVDGNPLNQLSLLEGQGEHICVIMKGGSIYKNTL